MAWAAGLALAAAGCSLMLDWDPDPADERYQPCEDGTQKCTTGFSCRANKCIPDGSLGPGVTCIFDQQCEGGGQYVCAPTPVLPPNTAGSTCKRKCGSDTYFGLNDSSKICGLGELCRPYWKSDAWVAACTPGECQQDEQCNPGDVCVVGGTGAGTCWLGCDPTMTGGTYEDGCGGDNGPYYCTPVGMPGSQKTACLKVTVTEPQDEGDACLDLLGGPCTRGLACIYGKCRKYCATSPDTCGATGPCQECRLSDTLTLHVCGGCTN